MEPNKIYNIDCLEGINKIADGTVDMITTDPPYCVGTTSNGTKGEWTDNNLIVPFFERLFGQYKRVLKDGGALYINTDWRTYPILYPIIQKYFIIRNLIVWDYGRIKAGNHYRFRHEFVVYATNGDSKRAFSAAEPDVWNIKPINFTSKNKLHNAQKPTELVVRQIENSSREGELILDTFIGSGTTPIACMETGRNFIGFEISEKVFRYS